MSALHALKLTLDELVLLLEHLLEFGCRHIGTRRLGLGHRVQLDERLLQLRDALLVLLVEPLRQSLRAVKAVTWWLQGGYMAVTYRSVSRTELPRVK